MLNSLYHLMMIIYRNDCCVCRQSVICWMMTVIVPVRLKNGLHHQTTR